MRLQTWMPRFLFVFFTNVVVLYELSCFGFLKLRSYILQTGLDSWHTLSSWFFCLHLCWGVCTTMPRLIFHLKSFTLANMNIQSFVSWFDVFLVHLIIQPSEKFEWCVYKFKTQAFKFAILTAVPVFAHLYWAKGLHLLQQSVGLPC